MTEKTANTTNTERTQGAIPEWVATDSASGNGNAPRQAAVPARRMLYRNPTDKLIGGVCGGIAEYLGWDPVLVRLLWVVATLATWGGGFLAYVLLAMFLPTGTNRTGQLRAPAVELSQKGVTWAAALLMGVGSLWLLANLGILPGLWRGFWTLVAVLFWPALLIGAGYLLLRANSKTDLDQEMVNTARRAKDSLSGAMPSSDQLRSGLSKVRSSIPLSRSSSNRLISGVCGGMGEKFGIDANLIRLIWVALTLGTMGFGAVIYAGFAILLPIEQGGNGQNNAADRVQDIQVVEGTTRNH